MKLTVIWKSTSPSGYPAKHYVLRKDSQGAEAYLHCVRILVPNKGANNPPNTIKTFKNYALIEYWDYYTMSTWATIVEAISKIQQYDRKNKTSNK